MAKNRTRITTRDTGWRRFFRNIETNGEGAVQVGIFADSDQVDKAMVHEFGAPGAGIPQRSFIRGVFDAKKNTIKKGLRGVAENVIGFRGGGRKRNLKKLGEQVRKFIVDRVQAGKVKPPLSKAWAKRKANDGYPTHPLEREGNMIDAVEVRIRK